MGRYSDVNVVFGAENGQFFCRGKIVQKDAKRGSDNMEEYIMRGSYEAFILVKVKDGRKFVCALNRKKPGKIDAEKLSLEEQRDFLENRVIWN